MSFKEILTERLVIRDLVESDAEKIYAEKIYAEKIYAEKIYAYRSLPEVARFQSWGIESKEEIQLQIKVLSTTEPGVPGSWYQVGITLRPSGELIGDCGFCVPINEPDQVEFGISLSPEHQSRGYATEALQALLDYFFLKLGKHRVFCSVDPRNLRSIKLMGRVGMKKEAHFIKSIWFKGEWVDDMIFAILAGDH